MRTGWGIDPATSCLERHSRTIAPHMLSSLKGSYTDFDNWGMAAAIPRHMRSSAADCYLQRLLTSYFPLDHIFLLCHNPFLGTFFSPMKFWVEARQYNKRNYLNQWHFSVYICFSKLATGTAKMLTFFQRRWKKDLLLSRRHFELWSFLSGYVLSEIWH